MIMPCMKSTSACERGGSVALVDGGNVLLGLPGAPGCTTTGFPGSVRWAHIAEEKIAGRVATSIPRLTADPLVEQSLRLRRKLYSLHFGVQPNILIPLPLKGSGMRIVTGTYKISESPCESENAQVSRTTPRAIDSFLRNGRRRSRLCSRSGAGDHWQSGRRTKRRSGRTWRLRRT